jgi:hypothetical protein
MSILNWETQWSGLSVSLQDPQHQPTNPSIISVEEDAEWNSEKYFRECLERIHSSRTAIMQRTSSKPTCQPTASSRGYLKPSSPTEDLQLTNFNFPPLPLPMKTKRLHSRNHSPSSD